MLTNQELDHKLAEVERRLHRRIDEATARGDSLAATNHSLSHLVSQLEGRIGRLEARLEETVCELRNGINCIRGQESYRP